MRANEFAIDLSARSPRLQVCRRRPTDFPFKRQLVRVDFYPHAGAFSHNTPDPAWPFIIRSNRCSICPTQYRSVFGAINNRLDSRCLYGSFLWELGRDEGSAQSTLVPWRSNHQEPPTVATAVEHSCTLPRPNNGKIFFEILACRGPFHDSGTPTRVAFGSWRVISM